MFGNALDGDIGGDVSGVELPALAAISSWLMSGSRLGFAETDRPFL